MSTSTIWGAAQSVENLCRGVRLVFTARHGGLLVSKGFAEKHIPQSVLEKIPFRDNYYQFEEDCDLHLVFFFYPPLAEKAMLSLYPEKSKSERVAITQKYVRGTIKAMIRWFPHLLSEYPQSLTALHSKYLY